MLPPQLIAVAMSVGTIGPAPVAAAERPYKNCTEVSLKTVVMTSRRMIWRIGATATATRVTYRFKRLIVGSAVALAASAVAVPNSPYLSSSDG